jgi:two-component system chemotaxis response regulator CheB
MKPRVLIVDDSPIVREILSKALALDPSIEVVGTAADAAEARYMIITHRPNVMTLDIEMPKMNGVEFLRRLMPQFPIATVMVSSLSQKGAEITMQALEAGAVDFIAKPSANSASGLQGMVGELREKIKAASVMDVSHWKGQKPASATPVVVNSDRLTKVENVVIAVAASTGGTEAIRRIVAHLPATTPAMLVAVHMPAGFTKSFAENLAKNASMTVKEAEDGEPVKRGHIYIAPGDKHLMLAREASQKLDLICSDNAGALAATLGKSNALLSKPSGDVLFASVAEVLGNRAVGLVLTGTGTDGAAGLKILRDKGAYTIAQDEASSAALGMPKAAASAAVEVLGIDHIPTKLVNALIERFSENS